jgi:hypothetical protein
MIIMAFKKESIPPHPFKTHITPQVMRPPARMPLLINSINDYQRGDP